MKKAKLVGALCALLCLVGAGHVRADSVTRASGNFTVIRETVDGLNLVNFNGRINGVYGGQDFSIQARGDEEAASFPALCALSCGPGELFGTRFGRNGNNYREGSITLGGTTYDFDTPNEIAIGFLFQGPDIIMPTFSAEPFLFFSVPIFFNGGGTIPGGPTLALDGRGSLELTLASVETTAQGNIYQLRSAEYIGAQAVPEPTTMLLLGTGLAGIGAAVRKRRRAGKAA